MVLDWHWLMFRINAATMGTGWAFGWAFEGKTSISWLGCRSWLTCCF